MAKKKTVPAAKTAAVAETGHITAGPKLASAMQGAVPIEGNIVNAAGVQILWAGNDCTIVFTRPRPALTPTGENAPAALSEVVAIISFSAATMKDLSIAVAEQVSRYEAKFGEIQTVFMKSRAAKKISSAKH
ncbi:MAG TPA: hypothetical protein VHC39_05985 [Rhizomicrobium sp.]|nr:hypothetical protein [Rhizomicrobium sp.]